MYLFKEKTTNKQRKTIFMYLLLSIYLFIHPGTETESKRTGFLLMLKTSG